MPSRQAGHRIRRARAKSSSTARNPKQITVRLNNDTMTNIACNICEHTQTKCIDYSRETELEQKPKQSWVIGHAGILGFLTSGFGVGNLGFEHLLPPPDPLPLDPIADTPILMLMF